MNRITIKMGFVIFLMGLLSMGMISCRKEAPTIAKVRIVDEAGLPVIDAMVRLFPDPSIPPPRPIVIDETKYTDADGYVIFDYTDEFNLGQAGFAVLTIEASKDDVLYGEGIIKVEPEVVSQEEVIIQ